MPGDRAALYAYVRPVPDVDPPLDAAIQRTAVRACARGERLGVPEVFEEGAPHGRAAFGHLATLLEEQAAPVILATVQVLGDTAIERARRLLLLEAVGARIICADGTSPESALLGDWEQRPDGERRRERARDAMRSRALRGLALGRPPFGYVVQERSLVPHAREAHVVKRIYSDYLDRNEGLRRIASALNRDGIRTHLGRAWTPGSVRTVLRNPVYTGLYRRLGVAVPRAHEALIDRGTFQAVQQRMASKRTSRLEQERHEYLLAGLLRCGRCGSPMIGDRRASDDGIVVMYRCEAATSQGRCRARAHRETGIVTALLEELASTTSHHPVAARMTPRPDPVAKRRRLERRLTTLVERWIAGEWRYAELVRRAASVTRSLQAEEATAIVPLPEAEEARQLLLTDWESMDMASRRLLLQAAVAEIVVSGDGVRIARRR